MIKNNSNKKLNLLIGSLLAILSVLVFASCTKEKRIEQIVERSKLVAITGYNAYSYFIYKGEPRGFEYDLVKKLAEHFNVELELKVVNDISEMFEMLERRDGDLIAFNLTVTKDRKNIVDFTDAINTTKQVLVQRKPDNWHKMTLDDIEKQLIRDPSDLIGKRIVARNGSAYIERLQNLSDEIGGDIEIISGDPDLTIEDLVAKVANGEIDFTVSDENIAKLNAAFHRNIDVKTEISLSQRIAWAVKKGSIEFAGDVNHWLDSMKKTVDFAVIYKKYFTNRYAYKRRLSSDYFSNTGGGISEYDSLIKKYSDDIGWDWRLAASLIYQESQFDPGAKSWAGAKGLMQLMSRTAKQFGVTDPSDPYQNLKAGFKFLSYLDNLWNDSIPDSLERIKFVLASYNIGQGHITDARNLTAKYNGDPNVWDENVEYYLKMKSNPKYYNDAIVSRGYARGTETIKYVKEILERFEHYKQLID
jgi:membrane-bound lytic murein transglycosylase F